MKYVMLILNTPEQAKLSPAEAGAWSTEIYAWYEKWGSSPRFESGSQLQGPETAKTLRAGSVTDGPFMETKEVLGGYSTIDADSYEEAIEITQTWPGLDRGLVTIELRPTVEM